MKSYCREVGSLDTPKLDRLNALLARGLRLRDCLDLKDRPPKRQLLKPKESV